MKAIVKTLWDWVPNKTQVLMTTLVVCVVLSAAGAVVVGVDVPFKHKTVLELYIADHYENWRVHANATKLFDIDEVRDKLEEECDYLEELIYKLEVSRLNIVGHPTLPMDVKSVELGRITSMKGILGKKLQAAKEGSAAATLTYKKLIAAR